MAEKVEKLGVHREKDFMYYVKDAAVWRVQRKQPGVPKGKPEQVAAGSFEMDTDFIYFVDRDGDVSRAKRAVGGQKRKKTTAPVKLLVGKALAGARSGSASSGSGKGSAAKTSRSAAGRGGTAKAKTKTTGKATGLPSRAAADKSSKRAAARRPAKVTGKSKAASKAATTKKPPAKSKGAAARRSPTKEGSQSKKKAGR